MTRAGLVALAFAAAMFGIVLWASHGQGKVSCEVCVTFSDRSQCRSARGPMRFRPR